MRLNRSVIPMLAAMLVTALVGIAGSQAQPAQPQRGYGAARGNWDTPPTWFNAMQRRGFQDGIDGAQKDFGNHRKPDVNNRWEYTHPNVPRDMWDAYRQGFRRGYNRAMNRLAGEPYQSMNRDLAWNAPPQELSDIERQGFMDGIDGAQKDFGNHRNPDVNNRWEYTHPRVPQPSWGPYQYGFRMGYDQAMGHLTGTPVQDIAPAYVWNVAPQGYSAVQRQGYQDGMDGAQKDLGNHRRPDVNNRWEYTHPNVSRAAWDAYRAAFRLGYERAIAHLTGAPMR
ncbi:MAG TPA: hypothetical protein VFI20_10915 [Terracidiphilus sp.]|nr:hypothetical protein [Terracidiphilus sp.]